MRTHLRGRPESFADLFCGTAAVSAFMRARGFRVTANDSLLLCKVFAEASLLADVPPRFDGLAAAGVTSRHAEGRYGELIQILNELPPKEGFIHKTYSPASVATGGDARMYFTEANSAALDAARHQIKAWRPHLTTAEHALLIVDLVKAANRVSNIAGTYGCYLKRWKARALEPLRLKASELSIDGPTGQVFQGEANQIARGIEAQVVYADPPYTKRQYAAYYHILETLVAGDEPQVSGSTGLRPWEHASSDYCYRRKAPAALLDLVQGLPGSPDFFLSYNEDGQIQHTDILNILGNRGRVTVHEFDTRRYKSSVLPHKGGSVIERLYHVKLAA